MNMPFLQAGQGALVTTPQNRRYLTGFPSSDGCVLLTLDAAYFLTDFRYIEAAQRQIQSMTCIRYDSFSAGVRELLLRHHVTELFIEGSMSIASADALQNALPAALVRDSTLDTWLQEQRLVKSPAAIAHMQEAQALTEYGFEKILPHITPGVTEREIALLLEFIIRRQGAECMAFDTIVVSGVNSSLPHGVPGNKEIQRGDFVTLDFGAVVDGWHSDMTRTVAVGTVSDRQRTIYETVRNAHAATLSVLREGVSCVEADAQARRLIAEAGFGDCFGHGTGHGVGMEIHELPRLSPSAGKTCLRAGTVVTVEPGIYLPGECGVRIEDMVVITPDGFHNFTHAEKDLLLL